ncbi:hypothetical protein ACFTWP_41810, partial [Kitasatospora sp. NPDC057015]
MNDSFCDEDGNVVDTDGWDKHVVARDLAAWEHFTAVIEHGAAFLLHVSNALRAHPPDAGLLHRQRELATAYTS